MLSPQVESVSAYAEGGFGGKVHRAESGCGFELLHGGLARASLPNSSAVLGWYMSGYWLMLVATTRKTPFSGSGKLLRLGQGFEAGGTVAVNGVGGNELSPERRANDPREISFPRGPAQRNR